MGSLSLGHWLVVLLVIVLVFGTKKLGNVGADLGKALKGFKDAVKGDEGSPSSSAIELNHQSGDISRDSPK